MMMTEAPSDDRAESEFLYDPDDPRRTTTDGGSGRRNATTTTTTSQKSSVWKTYQRFVKRHRESLDLLDDLLTRFLVWMPASSSSSSSSSSSFHPEEADHRGGTVEDSRGIGHDINGNDDGDGDDGIRSATSRWREVAYGVLSLHRMATDIACQNDDEDEDTGMINTYRATVDPLHRVSQNPRYGYVSRINNHNSSFAAAAAAAEDDDDVGNSGIIIPATSIRIALAVIHNLVPSILEWTRLSSPSSSSSASSSPQERTAYVRLQMERMKFTLRLVLLCSYWYQLFVSNDDDHRDDESSQGRRIVGLGRLPEIAGLLRDGGLYTPEEDTWAPSLREERSRRDRNDYVGKRTGRRVIVDSAGGDGRRRRHVGNDGNTSSSRKSSSSSRMKRRRNALLVFIAEIIHVYRPLHWAWAEHRLHHRRRRRLRSRSETAASSSQPPPMHDQRLLHLRDWASTLGMDLISLFLLRRASMKSDDSAADSDAALPPDNALNREELNRRKLKLLLYLLRGPVWDRWTQKAAHTVSNGLDHLPLVGSLLSGYMWEWLLYYKHPLASERD